MCLIHIYTASPHPFLFSKPVSHTSTRIPALLPVWSSFPRPPKFSSRVQNKTERKRERERAETKCFPCFLNICWITQMSVCHVYGLKLRFDSTTMMGLYEYILQLLPCIFMIFLLFFLSFLADCVEGEEPQHLREKEGEEEGEEEGRGWVADSAWYVFVCNRQVIASLLTGLPSGGVNRGGRESGEWEVQLVGWKVRGFRRGERSKVSPGSPCRCLVPVVHSCSSSSLSAGCIGARWCLQRENGTTGHRWMLWALAAEQSVAPFLLKFSKLSKRRATAER